MHRSKKRAAPVRLGSNYDLAFQAYVSSGQLRTIRPRRCARLRARPSLWIETRGGYALTTRSCFSGERYQSTAATSSNAGTSPTK